MCSLRGFAPPKVPWLSAWESAIQLSTSAASQDELSLGVAGWLRDASICPNKKSAQSGVIIMRKKLSRSLVVVLFSLFSVTALAGGHAAAPQQTLITNVNVFDGRSEVFVPATAIEISRRSRIPATIRNAVSP